MVPAFIPLCTGCERTPTGFYPSLLNNILIQGDAVHNPRCLFSLDNTSQVDIHHIVNQVGQRFGYGAADGDILLG